MIIDKFFEKIALKYKNQNFSGLCFNSLNCKKNNIFFAIKGSKTDGNKFINHAIKKGAKIIISKKDFEGLKKKCTIYKISQCKKVIIRICLCYL